jgi:hypothetical protein
MEEQLKKIEKAIKNLENKDFGLYFFVLDTKGNPTAGVANIYEHVKALRELGYNANILTEDDTYHGVGEWLGQEYMELPHISIKSQDLVISNTDFVIIPEIFAQLMDQIKGFPCKKIVFSQNYHYVLDILNPGKRWSDYGFNDVITTSDKQANYLKNLFPTVKTHVVPVSIPEYFKPTKRMKQPVINILCRNQGDAAKIAKSFYLQYPTYKFVTFKELRGMPRKSFAEELGKSCLAIWVDDVAGFGTFPLEAMECDTPVIGKIPNLIPEWMEEKSEGNEVIVKNNGVWTNNILNIPELIATYMKVWFEDSVPEDLLEGMKASTGQYTPEAQAKVIESIYANMVNSRKDEFLALKESQEKANTENNG